MPECGSGVEPSLLSFSSPSWLLPPLRLSSAPKGLTLSSVHVPLHTSELTHGRRLGLDICMLAVRYLCRRVNSEKRSAQAWEVGSRPLGPEIPGSWVPGIQSSSWLQGRSFPQSCRLLTSWGRPLSEEGQRGGCLPRSQRVCL